MSSIGRISGGTANLDFSLDLNTASMQSVIDLILIAGSFILTNAMRFAENSLSRSMEKVVQKISDSESRDDASSVTSRLSCPVSQSTSVKKRVKVPTLPSDEVFFVQVVCVSSHSVCDR